MFQKLLLPALFVALTVSACSKNDESSSDATKPSSDKPLVTVNGVALPELYGEVIKDQAGHGGQQLSDTQVREEVVRLEALYQEALKEGLDTPKLMAQLEIQKKVALVRGLIQGYAEQHMPSDEEVQAAYDQAKSQAQNKLEYNARHILVETEQEAREILAKLGDPKSSFEALAKEYSKDPGSASEGGKLGWSAPDAYVPEFAAALAQLKKGETTKEPVKTDFGYHIIHVDDVRQQSFPELADVKDDVVRGLQQKAVNDYVESLVAAAKVE
jgi:peptidyl-prolyl cis-trans isomerase C